MKLNVRIDDKKDNGFVWNAIKPNIKQFIKTLLEEKDKKFREIVGKEAHESDGWENAKSNTCCPGDDWADGYNYLRQGMLDKIK